MFGAKKLLPFVLRRSVKRDFEQMKELIEGDLIKYKQIPPKNELEQIHMRCCIEALRKVKNYY